jgi:hypothetical protein
MRAILLFVWTVVYATQVRWVVKKDFVSLSLEFHPHRIVRIKFPLSRYIDKKVAKDKERAVLDQDLINVLVGMFTQDRLQTEAVIPDGVVGNVDMSDLQSMLKCKYPNTFLYGEIISKSPPEWLESVRTLLPEARRMCYLIHEMRLHVLAHFKLPFETRTEQILGKDSKIVYFSNDNMLKGIWKQYMLSSTIILTQAGNHQLRSPITSSDSIITALSLRDNLH